MLNPISSDLSGPGGSALKIIFERIERRERQGRRVIMAIVHLSGHLKAFCGGETEIAVPGDHATVSEVLDSLWKQHPALRDRILNEQGEIRQHVNIFVGNGDVKRLKGLQTVVKAGEIHIFNAVSGG